MDSGTPLKASRGARKTGNPIWLFALNNFATDECQDTFVWMSKLGAENNNKKAARLNDPPWQSGVVSESNTNAIKATHCPLLTPSELGNDDPRILRDVTVRLVRRREVHRAQSRVLSIVNVSG